MNYIVELVIKLNSPGDFLQKITSLDNPQDQGAAILLLKERHGLLQDKFKKSIQEKLQAKNPKLKDAEASAIAEKILTDVLACEGVEGLTKMYRFFDKYSKEYGIKLDPRQSVSDVHAVQEA